MIVIGGHATLINGKIYEAPTNTLVETLKKMNQRFVYIRHSIDGNLPSIAYWYREDGSVEKESRVWVFRKPSILRYVTEIVATFFYALFHKGFWGANYIGVDPLNAFSGVILKKLGVFKKSIFFTADYATERFQSKTLNNAYHSLDRFAVKNSDQTWNVSSRIYDVRQKMGLAETKNIYVPNVPSSDYKRFLSNKIDPNVLVTLGIISEQLDFVNLFTAMVNLTKINPKIRLKIIGNGPKVEEYTALVKKLGLANNVEFLGFMSHDDALDTISKSGIGLALYNGNWSFNHYGDSMKCREFFCYGLPVITTDTHSTVEDIRKENVGKVCEMSSEAYEKAVNDILAEYKTLSANSKRLAEKYDGIHEQLLRGLIK